MPPFMGQGMCAGIRDASNLAWKIAYCLKNNHSEKLLNTYQSERYSNVKEYIKTTAKMGEFVNAIGTSNITGEVSLTSDGQKSMKSIKPKLGKGLSKLNFIHSKKNKNLEKFFQNSNSIAIIVRPDRFILSSCKSMKDFKSYITKNLSILV
jgi:3-(3-hydroxy-phenyl)propionate hydroxylase